MVIKEINAKSLLKKHKKIDAWFNSRYSLNLYRGCSHDCSYCDGRTEKYQVEGDFAQEIGAKINALDLLENELRPSTRKKPLPKGFIVPGGGVGDTYQPCEENYKLARKMLQIIERYRFPVHLITKSSLIERDIDILCRINEKSKVIVSFSFSSVDDQISKIFEAGASPPSQRLRVMKKLLDNGISCGIFLMPVIPFITDSFEKINEVYQKASELNADYVVFGGMTLKEGRQKDFFYSALKNYNAQLLSKYDKIYTGNKYGEADYQYYKKINQTYQSVLKKYNIPQRVPAHLVRNIISRNDLIVVILEQLDYLFRQQGKKTSYLKAAYAISQLKEPVSLLFGGLQLKGIDADAEKIIVEILQTGTSNIYEKILCGQWNVKNKKK